MTTPVHPDSGLSKATWTHSDYAEMSWHLCTIHAFGIDEYEPNEHLEFDDVDDTVPPGRLILDLDYVVARNPLPIPGWGYNYWVSPATLVFDLAWDVNATLGPLGTAMVINNLHRLEPPDGQPDPLWHIEGKRFDIRLRAPLYHQHLRRSPRETSQRSLTSTQRGGVSFAETSFA